MNGNNWRETSYATEQFWGWKNYLFYFRKTYPKKIMKLFIMMLLSLLLLLILTVILEWFKLVKLQLKMNPMTTWIIFFHWLILYIVFIWDYISFVESIGNDVLYSVILPGSGNIIGGKSVLIGNFESNIEKAFIKSRRNEIGLRV